MLSTSPQALTARMVEGMVAFMAQDGASDEAFNRQALALFAHQFAYNAPFQRFCRQRGKTPRTVRAWQDIPAVPISAFKALSLTCQPPSSTDRVFMTSGTTQGDVRGRHHHPTLEVYDASMRANFGRRFMQGQDRIAMGILFPTEEVMPNSSLAHYLALALQTFALPGSGYFFGPAGLDTGGLCAALAQAEATGQPYALLGASYSLVHLMDALAQQGRRFSLPAGSRVLDTGGFKGQSREIPMAQFYAQLTALLGVAPEHCINMYGMTELSTQFYDDGNTVLPSVKSGPHWIRSRLVNPMTGEEMAHGEQGVLAHCDLANFNSVTTILTEDVGVAVTGGFLLLGRAEGTQAKGCSLAVEEFLKAVRP
ncbi:MAG: long-chain fatty acid--CoA ligase [Polaromonas sp.]